MFYSILVNPRVNGIAISSENCAVDYHCVRESSMLQYFYKLCRDVMAISHI